MTTIIFEIYKFDHVGIGSERMSIRVWEVGRGEHGGWKTYDLLTVAQGQRVRGCNDTCLIGRIDSGDPSQ